MTCKPILVFNRKIKIQCKYIAPFHENMTNVTCVEANAASGSAEDDFYLLACNICHVHEASINILMLSLTSCSKSILTLLNGI